MRVNIENIAERSKGLVDVAMGRRPASMVIRSGRWVSVQSGEIVPDTDIAILDDRIAYVGPDASHTIGEDTEIIDADNRFLVPGLLDAHMHVESGMVTVTEFVRAVAPRGTTGMFIDPHEIANVLGIDGVRLMVEESAVQPIHVWVQMPSCVPSAPGLETPGAKIGPEEVQEAMKWDRIIGLGEMMNFPGVYNSDEKMHAEMAATRAAGKVIGGHYAASDLGNRFHAYAASGPEDDHEGTRKEDAITRVRQGMKAMLRLGSAWYDVAEQIRAVTEDGLDPRNFILCTDDSHSETLVHEGHMDRVVRHAISRGLKPVTAIQMATINTAEHFGLTKDIGMIAPGRYADILIVPDIVEMRPNFVLAKGNVISQHGKWTVELPNYQYPDWSKETVRLGINLKVNDFHISAPEGTEATVNVIGVVENQAPTKHLQITLPVRDGELLSDPHQDVAKVALVSRHRNNGKIKMGFVHGFGFSDKCAVASTVAHDSHHMIVVGTDDQSMVVAVNMLEKTQGGQVVVKDGEVIGLVQLPIAGLMSNESAEEVASKAKTILDGFRACGCELNNPNMQLSLLALVVIPELRISDLGLVDVNNFELIDLIAGE